MTEVDWEPGPEVTGSAALTSYRPEMRPPPPGVRKRGSDADTSKPLPNTRKAQLMTLSTHMWVLDPVDIEKLWPIGRALIHHYSERSGDAEWSDEPVDRKWSWHANDPEGSRTRMHTIGQGFCSMYIVEYVEGGGLRGDGVVVHDDDCDDPCEYGHPRDAFPYYVSVNLDTSYGYSYRGDSCGSLHAKIVGTIGAWLDTQSIRWCWENEFTGEIHQGADGLDALGPGADEASSWFLTSALPAVLADVVASR